MSINHQIPLLRHLPRTKLKQLLISLSLTCTFALVLLLESTKPVQAQSWIRSSDGRVPPNPVVGGKEKGLNLYICRGTYLNQTHAGKVIDPNCNIGYRGLEVLLNPYEVLVQDPNLVYKWQSVSNQQIPPNALIGGQSGDRNFYICRGQHQQGIHPGKLIGQVCSIGYGGKEIRLDRYEILVETAAFPLRANRETSLGSSRHMASALLLSQEGELQVNTQIWTNSEFFGFTGAISILFLDRQGKVVGATDVNSWGVLGRWLPGLTSERNEFWQVTIPEDLLSRIRSFKILHSTNKKKLQKEVKQNLKAACQESLQIADKTQYCPL